MVRFDVRHLRFSLKIVLLGLALILESTLAGCNGDSTSDFIKKQQVQEKAIATLTELGAKITKSDTGLAQGWVVDLSQVPFNQEIARQLAILGCSMNSLNLSKTSIDDSQLANLMDQQALDSITHLDLSHDPGITDQSLDKMVSLFNLRNLDLVGTQVTDAGIARLRETRKSRQLIPKYDNDDALKSTIPEGMRKSALEAYKSELKIRH